MYPRAVESAVLYNRLGWVIHGELDEGNVLTFVLDPQDPRNGDFTHYELQHSLQTGTVRIQAGVWTIFAEIVGRSHAPVGQVRILLKEVPDPHVDEWAHRR